MRLRWYKCKHTDITEALNTIETLYNLELVSINVYFKLKSGDTFYSLYDMATLEESNILMSKNILIDKRLENIICFSNDNIEIVKTVMASIKNWSESNKLTILNYLTFKLGVLSDPQKQIYKVSNAQKIEEVVVLLFNSLGINPAQILMPIDNNIQNEMASIEEKLNS